LRPAHRTGVGRLRGATGRSLACGHEPFSLSRYLDGEADDVAAIELRLAACAVCRGHLEGLRAVQRAIAVPRLEADPYFVVRFRARREVAARRAIESWRRIAVRLLLPATATAAVLAAVTVSLGDADRDSFWELERFALGAGSPRVRSAPSAGELEPLLAAALDPREPVRPRVAAGREAR
jgi:hypothetical protein